MYHIIVNPTAGKKKARRNLAIVRRAFGERGADCRVYETACEGDAKRIAAALTSAPAQETELASEAATADGGQAPAFVDIVVVGGDGTLHEVLNGIADLSVCRLGLIPSGTGNDFAEAVGIPSDAEKAAELILKGETRETDFLNVGGVRCMNVGGLGMDVDVLVRCKKGRIKGKIKYLLSLLQSLFSFKGYEMTLESGERKESHKALLAVACNGTQIGGGIRICPAAVPDDGKIDVMEVDCLGKREIIRAFGYLMKGRVLDYPKAEHFRCDRVRFTPAKPCTVQLDGELYDGLDFDAKIERGLKFYR